MRIRFRAEAAVDNRGQASPVDVGLTVLALRSTKPDTGTGWIVLLKIVSPQELAFEVLKKLLLFHWLYAVVLESILLRDWTKSCLQLKTIPRHRVFRHLSAAFWTVHRIEAYHL